MIILNNFDSPALSTPALSSDATDAFPISRRRKILNRIGWGAFAVFSLIFFSILKLPDDRLKAYIESNISQALSQRGITFTATEGKLSFLLGISYTMKNVTLLFPNDPTPAHIDKVEVSPSLSSLLFGRFGGGFSIVNGDGSFSGSFSMKEPNVSVSFKAKKLDIGKLGVLPLAAGIQGSAILDGRGDISGDFASPSTLDGDISLNISKLVINAQTIMGFSIPKISVSEGVAEAKFDKSKGVVKTLRLGKAGNPNDDIQGTLSGDMTLTKRWETSTLNMKTKFSLSPSILKSFILLDAILGGGKQADGSYAFTLTGPIEAPIPTAVGPGGV